jgi:hypothetical protein
MVSTALITNHIDDRWIKLTRAVVFDGLAVPVHGVDHGQPLGV